MHYESPLFKNCLRSLTLICLTKNLVYKNIEAQMRKKITGPYIKKRVYSRSRLDKALTWQTQNWHTWRWVRLKRIRIADRCFHLEPQMTATEVNLSHVEPRCSGVADEHFWWLLVDAVRQKEQESELDERASYISRFCSNFPSLSCALSFPVTLTQ